MVIALVGRRIDRADVAKPRFPYSAVPRVRERIYALFKDSSATSLVCSAACGADLIALDAARALGIRMRIVLPFDPTRFRETSVTDRPGDWGPIFDRIISEAKANDDLVNLNLDPDAEESYLQANAAILSEATRLAAPSGGKIVAAVVWNGVPRKENDITKKFADSARSLGLQVIEVSTT